jgi:hypothetical protein
LLTPNPCVFYRCESWLRWEDSFVGMEHGGAGSFRKLQREAKCVVPRHHPSGLHRRRTQSIHHIHSMQRFGQRLLYILDLLDLSNSPHILIVHIEILRIRVVMSKLSTEGRSCHFSPLFLFLALPCLPDFLGLGLLARSS